MNELDKIHQTAFEQKLFKINKAAQDAFREEICSECPYKCPESGVQGFCKLGRTIIKMGVAVACFEEAERN